MTELSKLQQTEQLDPREVDLVREVSMLNPTAAMKIYELRALSISSKNFRYIEALEWLKKNGLVGDIFVHFAIEHGDGSLVNLASYLNQRVERDKQKRPIMARNPI